MLTVGVDFGGTFIKVGLVDLRGRVVCRRSVSSRQIRPPGRFVESLGDAVEALARSVNAAPQRLSGVGLGAPGPVDVSRGVVHSCVNVPGWRDVPLQRLLERRLNIPCRVDNDANLVALGEWRFGAGKRCRQMVCVTLGTGVGGGLIVNGSLYRGAACSAGEVGHQAVQAEGRRCACGGQGCLEAYVGTPAILAEARRLVRRGDRILHRLMREADGRLTPALVSRAARLGDARAARLWDAFGYWLGIGVANLANVLNPERVVIAGGVANAWPHFRRSLAATVRAQAMSVAARSVRIVRGELGDDAGILGGAALVREER